MPVQNKFLGKLQGKKVLIVGGTSGIGYGVAEGCIEHGCIVHIASSSAQNVAAAVASLKAAYDVGDDRIQGHVCALNDKDSVEANIIALLDKVGSLDHLVHTAGNLPQPPQSADGTKTGVHAATIDDTIALGMVRLFAAQILVKHAVTRLPKSPSSSITLTSGSQSERPLAGASWGIGIAAGIPGLARGLAVDLAPIRVNCVNPGPVRTPIFDGFPSDKREAFMDAMRARALTGDLAEPEDTAEAYLYLMRDRSCTGSVIRNDTGFLLT